MSIETEVETLQEMKDRLGCSGSVAQIDVAINAIKNFKKAGGHLDRQNAAVVLHHLCIAIIFKSTDKNYEEVRDVLWGASNLINFVEE